MKKPGRAWWHYLLHLLVAGALLACVFSLINIKSLGELLLSCQVVPLFHAFLLFLAGSVSSSIAWRLLLLPLGYKLNLWQAIRLSLVGFFFNNLVPSGIGGDVYRLFAVSGFGVPKVHAAASVFVERWSAFLALLLATLFSYLCALPLLRGVRAGPVLGAFWAPLADIRLDWLMGIFLVLLSLAFLASCWWVLWVADSGSKWLERFSYGVPAGEFFAAASLYRRNPRAFLLASVINFASPLLEGLAFSSIADALGLKLSPLLFLAFTPIFRVLNHLPISINAVGTQEIASVVFWNPLGAKPDEAVAISLLIHSLKVMVSLVGAPLYYFTGNYRIEILPNSPAEEWLASHRKNSASIAWPANASLAVSGSE